MSTPYEQLGDSGVRRLAETFYTVMDERIDAKTIRAMHAECMNEITEKLYEYLCGWLGGPSRYADKYGTVCLTGPHKPYVIGADERDQWLDCMSIALDRIGASDVLKVQLKRPFFTIADAIRNSE